MDWQKIIRRLLLVAIFCFLARNKAWSYNRDSLLLSYIHKGLNFLSVNQIKTQNGTDSYIGEWPSFIHNTKSIPFLGKKGKSAYDSNLFNTLFIHNALAELFFSLEENKSIVPMLSLAQKSFSYYRNEGSFNFWPELPRPDHLKCKHVNCTQRRANHFDYHYEFINNYANIYDDADDTAAGDLAYYFGAKVKEQIPEAELEQYRPYVLHHKFVQFRDTGRRKANWYNKRLGFNKRTGAYLTWFGHDRKPSHFFTWFFPYHLKQNILYGRNEIDCVVNANILRDLYITGDTCIAGVLEAKEFLKSVIRKKVCFTCGVYYPTEYSFHYAIAKAIASGVSGFEKEKKELVQQIIGQRNVDGYWTSDMEGNDVQATLYAVNALMYLMPDVHTVALVNKAINYLLSQLINENEMAYWHGGVFFSGGSAIRYEHVWVSDAYTTCLGLEAIANYLKIRKAA
jgi:hypothetical protein